MAPEFAAVQLRGEEEGEEESEVPGRPPQWAVGPSSWALALPWGSGARVGRPHYCPQGGPQWGQRGSAGSGWRPAAMVGAWRQGRGGQPLPQRPGTASVRHTHSGDAGLGHGFRHRGRGWGGSRCGGHRGSAVSGRDEPALVGMYSAHRCGPCRRAHSTQEVWVGRASAARSRSPVAIRRWTRGAQREDGRATRLRLPRWRGAVRGGAHRDRVSDLVI